MAVCFFCFGVFVNEFNNYFVQNVHYITFYEMLNDN